ncbi:F-box/kelch-repeat protein At3g06240-like [Chenopodium quinoa]|uniref:F-box domain-containing protein n=1 Tax=Chenopodium quinoa TaxID=63459 RepID=A0A803LBN4_CHEQI|nr:F-box/kelch-repeat protein At3g06240-like [Chenopodium quinoa]
MSRFKYEDDPFLGLNEELILDILYRLPVKSLGQCKLVCKSWLTLISDPEFARSHLDYSNSINQPLTLIVQKFNTLSTLKFSDPNNITEGVTSDMLNNRFLDSFVSSYYYCFIVGSNDGLICVYMKEMERGRRGQDSLHLWNPCTTKAREISLPVKRGSFFVHIDSSWFGRVPSDDYKIFLVYSEYRPYPYEKGIYLYSLRAGRWRRIHVSDDEDLGLISDAHSVFFKDALHYLVCREWIVIFDLAAETFKKVPFSIKPDQVPKHDKLLLGVIGKYHRLCAMFLNRFEEQMFELWTLEEYDNWDSWKKLYRIDLRK